MKTRLYPELPHVHARLFGEDTPPPHPAAEPAAWAASAPPPPPFLADLIAARVASRVAARKAAAPAPGQVVLARVPNAELPNLVSVLLERQEAIGDWQGWLVTPDADYAGPGDVILPDEVTGLDPMAVLAQCWNPVRVRDEWLAGHLGNVTPATLAACSETARQSWTLPADPVRREYQEMYRHAASLIADCPEQRPAPLATGLARLAEALAAWAAATGALLTPSHWVPDPMHGACPYDACVLDDLVELQFFVAGSGLHGVRLRLKGGEAVTVDLEQEGRLLERKPLDRAGHTVDFVLPTGTCALRITGQGTASRVIPLTVGT